MSQPVRVTAVYDQHLIADVGGSSLLTVLQLGQVRCAIDLEHDDADDIIMGVQVELALLLDTGP